MTRIDRKWLTEGKISLSSFAYDDKYNNGEDDGESEGF